MKVLPCNDDYMTTVLAPWSGAQIVSLSLD